MKKIIFLKLFFSFYLKIQTKLIRTSYWSHVTDTSTLWWPEIFRALTQMFWSLFKRDSSVISGVICECARISARAQFSAPRTASLTEHRVTLDKTLTAIHSRQEREKWTQVMTTTLLQNWVLQLFARKSNRSEHHFLKKACRHGFLEHERVSWVGSMSEAHSSAD